MILNLLFVMLTIVIVSIHLRLVLGVKTTFSKFNLLYICCIGLHALAYLIVNMLPIQMQNGIVSPFGLLYGPTLYFCFQSLKGVRIRRSHLILHYLPFLIAFYLFVDFLVFDIDRVNLDIYDYVVFYGTAILSGFCYPLWVVLQKPNPKDYSEENNLLLVVSIIQITLSIYLFLLVTVSIQKREVLKTPSPAFYVLICILVIAIFIYSFLVSQLRQQRVVVIEEEEEMEEDSLDPSYQKSKIDDEITMKYQLRIEEYLGEKPYLSPHLSLDDFSAELTMSKHHCSQIINKVYGQSFPQLLNNKRIEYACSLLEKEELDLNMEELAECCGFNSKASFYRNFNNTKGCTPSQYRKDHIDGLSNVSSSSDGATHS